ncbi:sugar MFS transporter [Steroidobacter sp. S1-65]|uniref:Sugar MFS transporter n=1 Tax=Steroidobacter gossypii TaxID=2805490 RepID=A0ABS1X203_9GAMM|nr:sugar MFS transporter [Steroidobacter gossypii]MBM0107270.1 sugar MFS transporter [Steroidobacter gossypii]
MNADDGRAPSYMPALVVLTSLFFMWGFITSLNDILIPHLKAIFTLSYVQAMLIQFSFFGAYFVMSVPSGYLVEKLGYRSGIIIGLATAGVGCLGFYPAASMQSYPLFLAALFVLASGITLLQVAANPYVTVLGPSATAASRLNLTQAFNSLGTTVGPFLGSIFILTAAVSAAAPVDTAKEIETVQGPYLILAGLLFAIAIVFSRFKLPVVKGTDATTASADEHDVPSVWKHSHLVLGAVAIFMYVGAEVAIGSFLVNFMAQPEVGGLPEHVAGGYLSLYWGGAMVGRFIGAAVLRKVKPGHVLAFNSACAIALLLIAMATAGKVAMWAVLGIGLFNSIMFPTIFTLGVAKLGRHTGEGSGVLCMAIVGGAIVPVIQGYFADTMSLLSSFFVPALCYAYIVFYGLKGHVVRSVRDADISANNSADRARANM